jgi:hypothetical protein
MLFHLDKLKIFFFKNYKKHNNYYYYTNYFISVQTAFLYNTHKFKEKMKRYFLAMLFFSMLATCIIIWMNLDESSLLSFDLSGKDFNLPELESSSDTFLTSTRDFIRYNCKKRIRIGGNPDFIRKKDDKLWRIDGAWFVCLDGHLNLQINNCNVLSFGINHDYSFDREIAYKYGCKIQSFDPFVEADLFKSIRKSNSSYSDSFSLPVTKNWTFNRIGIVGDQKQVNLKNKIGWMATLDDILETTNNINKEIDILKMDIEGGESSIIFNLDIEYACKYFKQFIFETHPPRLGEYPFRLLSKLEKCFSLFHRDTRFFKGYMLG